MPDVAVRAARRLLTDLADAESGDRAGDLDGHGPHPAVTERPGPGGPGRPVTGRTGSTGVTSTRVSENVGALPRSAKANGLTAFTVLPSLAFFAPARPSGDTTTPGGDLVGDFGQRDELGRGR